MSVGGVGGDVSGAAEADAVDVEGLAEAEPGAAEGGIEGGRGRRRRLRRGGEGIRRRRGQRHSWWRNGVKTVENLNVSHNLTNIPPLPPEQMRRCCPTPCLLLHVPMQHATQRNSVKIRFFILLPLALAIPLAVNAFADSPDKGQAGGSPGNPSRPLTASPQLFRDAPHGGGTCGGSVSSFERNLHLMSYGNRTVSTTGLATSQSAKASGTQTVTPRRISPGCPIPLLQGIKPSRTS